MAHRRPGIMALAHVLASFVGVAHAKGQNSEKHRPPDDEVDGNAAAKTHACSSSSNVPLKSLG
jgi:hypothetical protein